MTIKTKYGSGESKDLIYVLGFIALLFLGAYYFIKKETTDTARGAINTITGIVPSIVSGVTKTVTDIPKNYMVDYKTNIEKNVEEQKQMSFVEEVTNVPKQVDWWVDANRLNPMNTVFNIGYDAGQKITSWFNGIGK